MPVMLKIDFLFEEEWQALKKKREEHEQEKQKMLDEIRKFEEERARTRELVKLKWRHDLEVSRQFEETARRKFFEEYKQSLLHKPRSISKSIECYFKMFKFIERYTSIE